MSTSDSGVSESLVRITLRLPASLHADLASRADVEGKSLNTLIVEALAFSQIDSTAMIRVKVSEELEAVESDISYRQMQLERLEQRRARLRKQNAAIRGYHDDG